MHFNLFSWLYFFPILNSGRSDSQNTLIQIYFEVLNGALPHLFYCVVQVLGGLVSAHILATDSTNRLVQGSYKNQLLVLAEDLGRRFLPAFDTPTGLPYAWINLKVLAERCLISKVYSNFL